MPLMRTISRITSRAAAAVAATVAAVLLLSTSAEALPAFDRAPYFSERQLSPGGPEPTVYRMRVGRHGDFDRVVFDFTGPAPGRVRVRYVDAVTQDGSGDEVRLAGKAFLQVTFSDTASQGLTYRSRIKPGYPTLKEVAFVSWFEGYVNFGIGVGRNVGFRVFELPNPTRIVVDVART